MCAYSTGGGSFPPFARIELPEARYTISFLSENAEHVPGTCLESSASTPRPKVACLGASVVRLGAGIGHDSRGCAYNNIDNDNNDNNDDTNHNDDDDNDNIIIVIIIMMMMMMTMMIIMIYDNDNNINNVW